MPKIKGSQIRDESVTGDQILNESIDENDIKDGSIKAAELSSEAITGQTLHSGSTDDSNDMLLIYDHSNTALRKIPLGDLMGPGGLDDAIEDADQDTGISVDNGSDEDKIRFRTANLERAIIDNAGNFGIGTSSPSSKLDVSGNVNVSGSVATNTIDANGDLTLDASGGQIYMKDDGITYLTFNVDGITDSIDAVGNLNLNATGDITINASGGDIKFEDNGVRRLTIEDGGNIGVGNLIPNPGFHLHLKKSTTSPMLYIDNIATDDTDFIYAKSSMDSDPDAGSYLLRWADSVSDTLYYVRGNGIGGSTVSTSFTAGHDTIMEITEGLLPGMIVESTGVIWYKPTELTFETALPKCRLTSSAMSNKVFGVIGGVPAVDEASKSFQESGGKIVNGFLQSPAFSSYGKRAGVSEQEVHLNTMSIGEGVIWVTNINGEVRNGDLICSSDIIGHGQLQNDDIMRSITVAKCTEDIPWNSISDVIEFNGAFYKKYLAACTFHCG